MRGTIGLESRESADDKSVQRWASEIRNLLLAFPNALIRSFDVLPQRDFDLTGIYQEGTITGEFTAAREERYNVRISFRDVNPDVPVACNCAVSLGKYACQHIYYSLHNILRNLSFSTSEIFNAITYGRYTEGAPDPKLYEYDEHARVRLLLSRLAFDPLEIDDAGLPTSTNVTLNRMAWNFSVQGHRLELQPMVQAAKARGGWSKGRRVAFASLRQYSESFSPVDRRIVDSVIFSTSGYRATPEYNPMNVLRLLMEQPNVLFDGEPVIVRRFNPLFVVKELDNGYRLQIDDLSLPSDFVVTDSACLVHIQPKEQTMRVAEMHPKQIHAIRAIMKLPPIPAKYAEEFFGRVRQLQNVLSVKLPESQSGTIVEDQMRPVVLLRSNSNGSLDYGIRVRDSLKRLRRPGEGLLLQTDLDNPSVQYQRDPEMERAAAERINKTLGIQPNSLDGSVDDFEEALRFIGNLQSVESLGVEVLWDESSDKPIHVLGSLSTKNVSVGISRKRDWFQLSGTCDLGEESINLTDVLQALQQHGDDSIRGDYVRIGNKGWTRIEQRLRKQLRSLGDSVSQDRKSLKFDATSAPAIRELMGGDLQFNASKAWHDCLKRLEKAESLEPVVPEDLNATLRDYQVEGFQWLRRLAEWGVGGILADDMGLGKTLQTLAVILDRSKEGPTLVIAPTSVGFNWVREAQRFAESLETHLYRETDRGEFLESVGPGNLVVCSYGLALRDAEQLSSVAWSTLVLDEAQAIKNSRSKTSMAIASIPAQWKVALTGTPVENHLGELWSLFHVISPGVFGGWDQFRKRYAAPIEKENDEDRRDALRRRLQPFVLRRTKSQVLKDLPPRSEMNVYVELSSEERQIYDAVRLSAISEIEQIAGETDVKDQRFKILALLTRLRQLACSPQLIDSEWTQRSSKLQQLCETVTELHERGNRVLIFSQFVKHLTLIREMLEEESISFEYLDGQTPAAERQACVDRFQNGDATAFLISLKAGGTGLNLTAADYVIHMDPWWNPAVEDQATDRAHRIGQEKSVMVYRFISQATIEEEILKLHDTKRDLVTGIMEGTQAAGKLSTDDLIALVRGE
ncbi:MAG: DEAD/DEAH box helicase [Pirellulaceae bacterium]